MAKPGPKTKYTPERVAQILEFLRVGNTRGTSAVASGISADTFSLWMGQHSEFSEQVKEAEQQAVTLHVGHIVKAADKGSWQAAAWILERRHHQDWGRKDRIELVRTVREEARSVGVDEDAAVQQAETILRELRSQARA